MQYWNLTLEDTSARVFFSSCLLPKYWLTRRAIWRCDSFVLHRGTSDLFRIFSYGSHRIFMSNVSIAASVIVCWMSIESPIVTACARNLSACSELIRVSCNTKSFLLKERALVMEDAREVWFSPPLDDNEKVKSFTGLGGSTALVSANLLIFSSVNSGTSGEGVGIGCSDSILSEELLRRRLWSECFELYSSKIFSSWKIIARGLPRALLVGQVSVRCGLAKQASKKIKKVFVKEHLIPDLRPTNRSLLDDPKKRLRLLWVLKQFWNPTNSDRGYLCCVETGIDFCSSKRLIAGNRCGDRVCPWRSWLCPPLKILKAPKSELESLDRLMKFR